jgi:RimJ/RimL family protein N-acetyltransferase
MRMPSLETDRLRIRPFEDRDLPAVRAILEADEADAATERYVRHGGLNAEVLADLMQPPIGDRAVELRSTGEVIGIAGLVPAYGPFDQLRPVDEAQAGESPASLHRIEIGLYYAVHPAHRRQGYASETAQALVDFAFDRLRLGRIVATTEHDNAGSQAVMRRLGMRLYQNPLPEPAWFQVVGIAENPSGT